MLMVVLLQFLPFLLADVLLEFQAFGEISNINSGIYNFAGYSIECVELSTYEKFHAGSKSWHESFMYENIISINGVIN